MSQGIGLTDVSDQSIVIYQNNLAWNWVSAPTYGQPYQTVTITANLTNTGNLSWNGTYYIQLSDSAGNHLAYQQVSGVGLAGTATVSFNVTLPNIGGNGTVTYYLEGEENNVQYFGPIQSVPFIIDYAPATTLSASPTSTMVNSYVVVTSTTTAGYVNLINQAIDYISPGGSGWVSGSETAGTRWDGGPVPSETLSPSLVMSTIGTWQFRARGQDSVGQLGAFAYVNVSVNPAAGPVITSPGSVSGTFGTSFNYGITASNSPTSYGASNLPPGLSVDTNGGVISGVPTSTGTWQSMVSATNSGGTGTETVTITINPQTVSFSASPTSFSFTGSAQGPTVSVTPSGATYSESATNMATNPGSYSFTLTATGNYTGGATINWTISSSGALNLSVLRPPQ